MERTSTWESIGVKAQSNDYLDLLKNADLDYDVVARDAYVEYDGNKILVPNKKVILREDTKEVFGVVGSRYALCQNREALDFLPYIDDMQLVKAGSQEGYVWMIGKLPEVEVLGDKISPNLIFQNSHDGSCSIKTTICMLRIVCQNQFTAAFADSPATITITHQGDMDQKLLIAKQTMMSVYDYVKSYQSVAESLATKKITPKRFDQIVEGYFKIPENASTRTMNAILDRREAFQDAYNADDNQNFKGTKWGLINAYSDLVTHEEYSRKSKDWQSSRFFYNLRPQTMGDFMNYIKAAA